MTGQVRRNRRFLAAGLCVFGFVACNTYDPSLIGSLDPSLPAGEGGASGSSPAAGTGAGGSDLVAEAGAIGVGGVPDAGSSGSSGSSEGGEAGDSSGGYSGMVTGGIPGAGGSTVAAGAAGLANVAGAPSGSLELIDDFEDGDAVVSRIHGRNGPWYTFSDATVGGTLSAFSVAALTGSNLHDDSTGAAHLTATGFTDWGAGVGADFLNPTAPPKKNPYDVSAYKGVHFYAKVASGASTALKVLLITASSDPSGGICSDAQPTAVPSQRCNDHLYAQKTIKTTWATFDVLFTDLIQQGFGLAQPTLDPKSVYSLQFIMPAKLAPVDLWLDDVSFIVK